MNGLSWIIYLVGVVENAIPMIELMMTISIVCIPIAICFYLVFRNSKFNAINPIYSSQKRYTKEEASEMYDSLVDVSKKTIRYCIIIACVSVVFYLIVPTKQTMVLIAASEVAETVVTNEMVEKTVGEVGQVGMDSLNLLKDYIRMESTNINQKINEATKPAMENVR